MLHKSLLYGLLLIFSCCFSQQLNAQYILALDSVQAFPGNQVSIGISIQNAGPVTSFQCDIPLPSTVGIDPQSLVLNPARSVDHLISAAIVQDTVLRILCFSINNTPFNGNQGEVAGFVLSLPNGIMEAPLPLTNALIANLNGQNVITVSHYGAIKTMGPLHVEIVATDDSLCQGTTISLEATVTGGGWHPVLIWSSDPPGFDAVGASVSDEPISSQLYIINVDDGFQTATDTHAILVFEPPWVEAGEDQLICYGETVGLNAAFGSTDSLVWSGGNGIFDDPNNPTTVYVPSPEDLTLSEIWLTVQAFGSMLCEQSADSLLLTLSAPAQAEAGTDYVVPLDSFYENTDAIVYGADSLFWTSSGDGSFVNASLLHPTYLPGTRDVLNGEVSLRLHVIPSAPCEAVSDSLQLIVLREGDNVMQLPALSANPNDTILLSLYIENRSGFNSFTSSMLLPEGISWIASSAQLTDRAVDHQLSLEQMGQQLHCTVVSPTNQAFNGNTGPVFNIQLIASLLPGIYPLEIIAGSMINEAGNEVLTDIVGGELILLLVGEDQIHSLSSPLELHYLSHQQQLEITLTESCELHLVIYSLSGKLTGEIRKYYSKGKHHINLADLQHRQHYALQARIVRVSMHCPNQTAIYKTLKLW